jgi:hypothetical protein
MIKLTRSTNCLVRNFSYVYINKHTKLSDLQYKEEIFEYVAYKYSKMSQNEINEIIVKLMNFKILKPEVVEFKNLLRNIIMVTEKLTEKEVIRNLIQLVYSKLDDINEYINDDLEVDNGFDTDFSPVLNEMFSFINNNLHLLDKDDIITLFKIVMAFNPIEGSLLYLLGLYSQINQVEGYSLDQDSEIISILLELVQADKFTSENLNTQIKGFIKDYLIKLKCYLNEFDLKRKQAKLDLTNKIKLYHKVNSVYLLDKESKVNLLHDELKLVKSKLEKVFYVNKKNPKTLMLNYKKDSDSFRQTLSVMNEMTLNKNNLI